MRGEGPKVERSVHLARNGIYVCLVCLIICCCVGIHSAWRWPLVGDASLIRYVVFLIHSGRAPYSQVIDINLPGSYFAEYAAMKIFGWGDHGLRLYDGFLCAVAVILSYLAGNKNKQDSLFCLAGGLFFVLIHLQDGLDQAGQRDFVMAVLALGGLVTLIRAKDLTLPTVFAFELIVGFTLTIKPTLFAMAFLPLLMLHDTAWRKVSGKALVYCAVAVAGLALPVAIMFAWLVTYHSVHAFYSVLTSIDVLHSQLGRKSAWFRFLHCMSPILGIFIAWLILVAVSRPAQDIMRRLIIWAMCFAFVSYFLQGKALPYQRYPFLIIGIILILLDCSRAIKRTGPGGYVGFACVIVISLVLAPKFTLETLKLDAVAPFQDSLIGKLENGLKGKSVQCLDTYGGCINVLYDMRVQQATGYLYDCYLFTPESETRDRYRKQFVQSFVETNPSVVILTNDECFASTRTFARVGTWPALNQILSTNYVVSDVWNSDESVRWWSRAEHPVAYRVYTHR